MDENFAARIRRERKEEIIETLQDLSHDMRGMNFTPEQWDDIRSAYEEIGDVILPE